MTKAEPLHLKLGHDEYPPRHKRLLLLADREGEDFGDYVVAAESIPDRMKTAKQHYQIIIKAVNWFDVLRDENQRLRVAVEAARNLLLQRNDELDEAEAYTLAQLEAASKEGK